MRARAVLTAFGLTVLVSACSPAAITGTPESAGSGAVDGGTSAPPSSSSSESFDPCTGFSNEDLEAAGLTSSSKTNADVANGQLGRGCSWDGQGISAGVIVTDQTVATIAARSDLLNAGMTTIGGKQAVQFQLSDQGDCGIAVDSGGSSIAIIITLRFSSVGTVDPCAEAVDVATTLVPLLPQ